VASPADSFFAQTPGLSPGKPAQIFAIAARKQWRFLAVTCKQTDVPQFAKHAGERLVDIAGMFAGVSMHGAQLLGQAPRTPPPSMPILVFPCPLRASCCRSRLFAAGIKCVLNLLNVERAPWQGRHFAEQSSELAASLCDCLVPAMFLSQLLPSFHRHCTRAPGDRAGVGPLFKFSKPVDRFNQRLAIAKI
jgi:hypothetical protein